MTPNELISLARSKPQELDFDQVMQVISENYRYQATPFNNGPVINAAGTNEGSCKIFYFAHLNKLNKNETLHLFGNYYRKDVLDNPTGNDHGNIRGFIKTGWPGIHFEKEALIKK